MNRSFPWAGGNQQDWHFIQRSSKLQTTNHDTRDITPARASIWFFIQTDRIKKPECSRISSNKNGRKDLYLIYESSISARCGGGMRGAGVEYCLAARLCGAGARGSAWRWRSEQSSGGIYAGSTNGRQQPGSPDQREGGSRAWGSPTEARQDLAAVEAAACLQHGSCRRVRDERGCGSVHRGRSVAVSPVRSV